MKKSNAKPESTPPSPPEPELPVVSFVGWHRTSKGWVVVKLRVQGSQIVEREIVGGPDTSAVARERLILETHGIIVAGLQGSFSQ